MSCGTFQFGCQIGQLIEPYWIWITWGFWIAIGLVALWALAKIKELGGWPAVTAAIGVLAYGIGHVRGRRGEPLIPDNPTDLDGPDVVVPARRPAPKSPRKKLFPNAPWNKGT